MGYIYLYFNKYGECKYIGQSIDWKRRFYQHSHTDMIDKIIEVERIVVIRCGKDKMNSIESYLINTSFPKTTYDLKRYKKFVVYTKEM